MRTVTILACLLIAIALTPEQLTAELQNLLNNHSLMGMAVEVSKNGSTIYKHNFGLRDYDRNLTVDNNTMFRMASLSKSIAAAGLMLLVSEGKVKFTDNIATILGFPAINPNFPNIPITV